MKSSANNARRFVVLRDDDTNALTPIECLERLYRPFLARGLPVNLATIPEVSLDARTPEGRREGFLPKRELRERLYAPTAGGRIASEREGPSTERGTIPLAENPALVDYLHANAGYRIVQHGCHHSTFEFDRMERGEIVRRIERGATRLREAGFEAARTFVAPHDKISPVAYEEIARRFAVVSTGWFEWRRLPRSWRLRYLWKKLLRRPHWRVNGALLLSHPGCLLSYQRSYDTMLDTIRQAIARQRVTVLVTHWWEYFREGRPDEPFIAVLHALADHLATQPDVCVTTFDDLTRVGRTPQGISAKDTRPYPAFARKRAAPSSTFPEVISRNT